MTARPVHWWSRWHDVGSAEFHVLLALWSASHLCPTVASATSRRAKFVVDSCQHQSISATGIICLTSLFSQLDRHEEDQTGRNGQEKKKASK